MVRVRSVESVAEFETPELAPYRTMRWQHEQRQQGIFVAEGEKVVRRLLESDFEVVSLLLPRKWYEQYADSLGKRPEPAIDVFTAEKPVLEQLTGFSFYQGVLAVARVPKTVSLEETIRQKTLQKAGQPKLLVALDEISSAPNMGGLIRNCVAFGVDALVVGETCCSPWLRRSVRSSMGTIFKLPIVEAVKLTESIELMKRHGMRIIAAHAHTEQRSLSQVDFRGDCTVVLGSEGYGLSEEVLKLCDEEVVIPMQNEVDSLNVGTAGAIFLYEVSRQRGMA
jgi:tRNA G18 (ribose-2'-O)-methylase SpoU